MEGNELITVESSPVEGNELIPAELSSIEEQAISNQSAQVNSKLPLTETLKTLLNTKAESPIKETDEYIVQQTTSVLQTALRNGMTLQQYVARYPDKAMKLAESHYDYWLTVVDQAAINGELTTADGTVALTKNQTRMIEKRLEAAKNEMERVYEYALTAYREGEQKRDQLIRVAFHKAIHGKNDRMLTYLIDRYDGKAPEMPMQEYDYDYSYNVYQIIQTLFKEQLQVLNSGSGTKLICCSRRAGKTHLLVAAMLIECQRKPNTKCIYIGETAELSEQLIASAANEIVTTCNLRDKHGKPFNWKKMDNGSQILVRGLSNTKDPDQIRGNKAKIIVIDEFFHLKSELLSYLKEQVLEPMQMDYADDYKFICAGTPPSIKNTYGEYAWRTWECDRFEWTWRNNPHPVDMKQREAYVERKLQEKGLDWTSAYARREYNGEWAYDDELLLYPEYYVYDPREGFPQIHIDQVLIGLDYGVSDNDTLVAVAWDNEAKQGYELFEVKFSRLDIVDRSISQLEYLRKQVEIVWIQALELFPQMTAREANKRILWDADDNDQHITDDLNVNVRLTGMRGNDDLSTLKLNIQNAHKTDKVVMQDKIQAVLRKGNLLLIKGGKLADECDKTVLQRGAGGQVLPMVDDSIYHPDLLPALRYCMYNVLF